MIKKVNQYLITNHPQLWNTKLVWMLSAIALTHLLFFTAGYLHFDSFSKLHFYQEINNQFIESANIYFSALASVLLITVWLVFYLRNNPFKSFYPLKPLYFLTEFSIIVLIVFSSILFYRSYAEGFCKAIRVQTAGTNLVEETNTLNLAYGLIPVYPSDYTSRASCDSADYLDSMEDIRSGYYRLLHRGKRHIIVADSIELEAKLDSITDVIRTFENADHDDSVYSLINYCKKKSYLQDSLTYSKYEISEKLQLWLTTGNRQEVTSVLQRFDTICRKYQIPHNVNITDFARYAFADSNFQPSLFISDPDPYDYDMATADMSNSILFSYIEMNRVKTALANIVSAHETKSDEPEFWLRNLFLALTLSTLFFTFRLSSIRVWFTAVAVHLALPFIAALAETLLRGEETILATLALGFALLVYVMHFVLRKRMKKTAGVLLTWFTWWLLYIGVFAYLLLLRVFRPETMANPDGTYTTTPSPAYDFLQEHRIVIGAAYMLFVFLYTGLVLSRHYRKWMASPEE
jgi:hypothetical protein